MSLSANSSGHKDFPPWLKKKVPSNRKIKQTRQILDDLELNTVCESASCANMGECFSKKTATFMIMGNTCTRNCQFCAVTGGEPETLDQNEPDHLAQAVVKLGLKHVVITSVTRDDLGDGGASHFAECIKKVRSQDSEIIIEVLTPDFNKKIKSLKLVADSDPDIFNHNVETIPRFYDKVRPEADYQRSLKVISLIKDFNNSIFTKSGIMVGLGETETEVIQVMKDLRSIDCDILTIGQYLQPTSNQVPVEEYITPEQFSKYEEIGRDLGFKYIASGPYVRSSYQADDFSKQYLREER